MKNVRVLQRVPIEILSRLEEVDFTSEQARVTTGIFDEDNQQLAKKEDIKSVRGDIISVREDVKSATEDTKSIDSRMATKEETQSIREDMKSMGSKMATKDEMRAEILKSKYDLVKWIVGGIIANSALNALLKYFG